MNDVTPPDERRDEFTGEPKDYRQPLVTSLGIILGFILNFMGTWVNTAEGSLLEDPTDAVILGTVLITAALLIVVLFRMLSPRARRGRKLNHYNTTLRLYAGTLIFAFLGLALAWFV